VEGVDLAGEDADLHEDVQRLEGAARAAGVVQERVLGAGEGVERR
jgi:hypothetical protein